MLASIDSPQGDQLERRRREGGDGDAGDEDGRAHRGRSCPRSASSWVGYSLGSPGPIPAESSSSSALASRARSVEGGRRGGAGLRGVAERLGQQRGHLGPGGPGSFTEDVAGRALDEGEVRGDRHVVGLPRLGGQDDRRCRAGRGRAPVPGSPPRVRGSPRRGGRRRGRRLATRSGRCPRRSGRCCNRWRGRPPGCPGGRPPPPPAPLRRRGRFRRCRGRRTRHRPVEGRPVRVRERHRW